MQPRQRALHGRDGYAGLPPPVEEVLSGVALILQGASGQLPEDSVAGMSPARSLDQRREFGKVVVTRIPGIALIGAHSGHDYLVAVKRRRRIAEERKRGSFGFFMPEGMRV